MKRLFGIALLWLLCAAVLFAGGKSEAADEGIQSRVITVAHVAAEGQYHPYNVGLETMQQALAESTGGKISLKIYAGGSLSNNEKEMLTLMQSNSLDMAVVAPSPLSTYEPTISILGLPYIFRSLDHCESVMQGEVGDYFLKTLEDKGFVVLAWWMGKGFRSVNNSIRPIYTPEDMKGMKIRVMEDPVYIDTFKAFGANPVPIAWGELHTALQTKTVDAHENDPQVIDKYGFIEFAKYFSLTEHTMMPIAVVMSKSTFDALGPEGQKAVLDAAAKARADARKVADEIILESYEGIRAQGGEVNEVADPAAFRAVALPVIEEYKDKFGEDGKRLIDIILE